MNAPRRVYLDWANSAPLLPAVVEAMAPYWREVYGNPQSLHQWGDETRQALDHARAQVAALIGGQPGEIVFTSSGTEANNMAVKGIARFYEGRGKHIVISAVEHFSVLQAAKSLEKAGWQVSLAPVDKDGLVSPDAVAGLLRPETALVSVMHANGEVGTLQPLKEIVAKVKASSKAFFHTDAVDSAGFLPVNVTELGVDALTLAGNVFYGPKGSGALWLRKGVRALPLMEGGIQEDGRRPGTENVPACIGLGKAAELARLEMASRSARLTVLRDRLIRGVLEKTPHVVLTGHPTLRLPFHTSFCVRFIEGEAMLMLLDSKGVAVTSGSACTSRALKASHVLLAMGVDHELAQGSLMVTLGIDTTEADVDYFIETLPPVVDRLRQMSPVWSKFIKQGKGA
jgi:cysteine desulfurase